MKANERERKKDRERERERASEREFRLGWERDFYSPNITTKCLIPLSMHTWRGSYQTLKVSLFPSLLSASHTVLIHGAFEAAASPGCSCLNPAATRAVRNRSEVLHFAPQGSSEVLPHHEG